MVIMNKLNKDKRTQVIGCLVEGNSINATCRMTGVAKMTVLKLLRDVGTACLAHHDETVRGLRSKQVQCDEVWSFCYAKDKNLPPKMRNRRDVGSVWTWTALDADSKLMISWHVGQRSLNDARYFIGDLAGRLTERVQITTDGRPSYLSAIIEKFPAHGVDYGVLLKIYGPSGNDGQPETRYSPGRLIRLERIPVLGKASDQNISTSFVERMNLTLRMGNRRFTRLTNGFSKKFENHCFALAIQMMHYNFARMHKTLRCSPAMAAGLTKTLWSVADLVALADRLPARAA
jgi:IS1 family transposase